MKIKKIFIYKFNLIKNIIDKCVNLNKINNNKIIIEILKIISSKNNGDEISETILNFIIDNYNYDNNNNNGNKLIELEIISNLSNNNSSLKKY